MLRTSESDTEILLGNKQLLGIFFVVAILLGAAFTGGYMAGQRSSVKKTASVARASEAPLPTSSSPAMGETHEAAPKEPPPLGSPDRKNYEQPQTPEAIPAPAAVPNDSTATPASSTETFVPQSGQVFLQVAAVGRDEAEGVADVLRKKHFRAHAVPKPGSAKLFRVLIGPVRDAADLSSTRDALRKTGFGEVIVQKY
jgi:cell division protein FtsN